MAKSKEKEGENSRETVQPNEREKVRWTKARDKSIQGENEIQISQWSCI